VNSLYETTNPTGDGRTESTRPSRPVFQPAAIPRELQEVPRWVCWAYTWSGAKKKWDKPPRRADGRLASSTDAATWCGFGRAVGAVTCGVSRFDGIGHALAGDGLVAVDLDRCIAEGHASTVRVGDLDGVDAWARSIVIDLDSYTELSPSGRGLRVFVRGSLPPESGNRKGCFEVYDLARYVTVTGDRIATMPEEIEARQIALETVVARMLPLRSVRAPSPREHIASGAGDEALLERARSARNGEQFRALFDRGELATFGGDHSRADLALCSMLAFWCGGDAPRIERLFRRSALFREKWDERHRRNGETYGEMTVAKALR
jgi:putative DNA primase/helicase